MFIYFILCVKNIKKHYFTYLINKKKSVYIKTNYLLIKCDPCSCFGLHSFVLNPVQMMQGIIF